MKAIKPYSEKIEAKMLLYYKTWSEKERRRYAAIEYRSRKNRLWWHKLYGKALRMSFRDNLKGQLYREGKTLNQKPLEVYDHDWASLAEGQVIPHGLYPTFRTWFNQPEKIINF